MRQHGLIIATLVILVGGCAGHGKHQKVESEPKPAMINADPVGAIRSALPKGWSVLEVVGNTYPFYRPEGSGISVKLIMREHGGLKPPYDAIVFVMPGDYVDGGEDPTHGKAQTTVPALIAEASNGKVYLWAAGDDWPTIRQDVSKALLR